MWDSMTFSMVACCAHRVTADDAAVLRRALGELHQVVNNLVPGEGSTPTAVLLLKAGVGNLPTLVVSADEVVARNPHVVQEYGPLPVADEQVHLVDGQPLGRHGYHKEPQIPMPGRVRVGEHGAKEPLGLAVRADEHVGAGQQPVVAVADGLALVVRQVGSALRLRELLPAHLLRA